MAKYQGIKRLNEGFERKLTNSEVSRAYMFITNDKTAKKEIGKDFIVYIGGKTLRRKRIDNFGRIPIDREIVDWAKNSTLHFSWDRNKNIVVKKVK